MELRAYQPKDCKEMAELFYHTIHAVNIGDYTKEQVDAWADGRPDLEAWNRSFLEHDTVVAVDGTGEAPEKIVAFGDMDGSGYLDRLYVHWQYQGQGLAAAICDRLESHCGCGCYVTHASITARPFFEKRGYRVIKEQQVSRHGQWLTNYVMEKKA